MKTKLMYLFICLISLSLIQGCEDSDDENGLSGMTTLEVGEPVTGSLSGDEAQFSFSVDDGTKYQLLLTPESSNDDPDLLVFSSEQQLGDYWDIADSSGGEDSSQAMEARVAKSSLSPGVVDKASFEATKTGMYFAAVTGPENTRFTILLNSSDSYCADECVDNTNINQDVESTFPSHDVLVATIPESLEMTFASGFTLPSSINIEIFELPSGSDECQIIWSGFRCGMLDASESGELVTNVINASSQVNGQRVTFTPESQLLAGHTYVVHIFADSSSGDFKTWWRFDT
ncbi:hypothetical protein KO505_15185 [Psychrosphaera sp. F3M07]|uniref:hypothetical protein n=1 Tax=Psychrosphaera sp. F3M07 TaxID=2841560 RepID=UPI001C0A28CA|nr:hypothetical protein [Psychrosphaera sp. F3M07]MBU2919291.1 hypothetical protein [Psychrosphaera sp. F3M07]